MCEGLADVLAQIESEKKGVAVEQEEGRGVGVGLVEPLPLPLREAVNEVRVLGEWDGVVLVLALSEGVDVGDPEWQLEAVRVSVTTEDGEGVCEGLADVLAQIESDKEKVAVGQEEGRGVGLGVVEPLPLREAVNEVRVLGEWDGVVLGHRDGAVDGETESVRVREQQAELLLLREGFHVEVSEVLSLRVGDASTLRDWKRVELGLSEDEGQRVGALDRVGLGEDEVKCEAERERVREEQGELEGEGEPVRVMGERVGKELRKGRG